VPWSSSVLRSEAIIAARLRNVSRTSGLAMRCLYRWALPFFRQRLIAFAAYIEPTPSCAGMAYLPARRAPTDWGTASNSMLSTSSSFSDPITHFRHLWMLVFILPREIEQEAWQRIQQTSPGPILQNQLISCLHSPAQNTSSIVT
jgi:hypothetical protein